MKNRRWSCMLALAAATASPAPAVAADQCSCRHLESLQQELENAVYEASFFAELAKRLAEIERRQTEVNKDPTHPDSGRLVLGVSANARGEIMGKEFRLPHDAVKGYTGPNSVDMIANTCKQNQADLTALENGASCREIGEITAAHEAQHRATCEAMGADKYWARLPSVIAAEEAERYRDQANAMRSLLKKVIDDGTIRVSAIMEPRVTGPEFDVTYSYVTPPIDLEGKSSSATDRWTLSGQGVQTGTIKRAKIGGMTCSPYGAITDKKFYEMDTDGLTMSLSERSEGGPGDIGLRCEGGFGMSMRPRGEGGSGQGPTDAPFAVKSEIIHPVGSFQFASMLAQGGMSVSGEHRMLVELVCPGM